MLTTCLLGRQTIMDIKHLIDLANDSGGTLYVMIVLLTLALTVIIERSRYLSNMIEGGEQLIKHVISERHADQPQWRAFSQQHPNLPHLRIVDAAFSLHCSAAHNRQSLDGLLEEAVLHEVPKLDRSLWMLDTIITLAPLLGLFGTIFGMFNTFSALGGDHNEALQVTSGIAESLLATASGLVVAMVGLIFFNGLNTRIRLVVHQLETVKVMLLNRLDRLPRAA